MFNVTKGQMSFSYPYGKIGVYPLLHLIEKLMDRYSYSSPIEKINNVTYNVN